MLVRHPKIYLAADGRTTDSLLIRDGRVVAVGAAAEQAASAEEEIVTPEGACVFPALTDAHIHLWGLGLRHGSVSLKSATTTEGVYSILRDYELDDAPGGWVLGRDWDQHHWVDGDALDIARLDELFPGHPVVLRRIDGHALWVNTVALRRAGISDDWNPGPNGHVARDDAGRPTGLLVDDATDPVLEAIPEPDVAEDRAVFLESCEMLIRHGVAGAHVAWMPLDRMEMLEELHGAGELPIRLNLFLDGRSPDLAAQLERGPRFDDWLTVNCVKYFADGALGSQGAHLTDGYSDGSTGLVLETRGHLLERCPALAAAGWQIAIHAIGDAAARSVLDAFEAIAADHRASVRPRLEHAQMVTDEDVPRFAALGVIPSIQPIHMYSDAAWADDELTAAQLRRLFRWRDLLGGPPIAGGSDYPIEDPNPWHGIATAVSRCDRKGRVFRAEHALTVEEALATYTTGAAWAGHREQSVGRLDPGYHADFIALGTDPFEATAEELWDMAVLSTWIGGRGQIDAHPATP